MLSISLRTLMKMTFTLSCTNTDIDMNKLHVYYTCLLISQPKLKEKKEVTMYSNIKQ